MSDKVVSIITFLVICAFSRCSASENVLDPAAVASSALKDSSLLLVPASAEAVNQDDVFLTKIRKKRSASVDPITHKKYHRLAHAVHVQSDIRYR